jgi:O-antigen/teichoic acid export membrane protein
MFKKVGLNGAAYAYNQLVTIAIQFLLVPLFLKYWGPGRYGEWLVLSGVTTMLTVLDFGVTHASSTRATIFASKDDWAAAKKTYHTALLSTLSILAFFLPIAIGSIRFTDPKSILNLNLTSVVDSKVILSVLICNLGIWIYSSALEPIFRMSNRFALGALLLGNRRAIELLMAIIVLPLQFSPLAYCKLLFVCQATYATIVTIVAMKIAPTKIFGLRNASLSEFKLVLAPAFAYFMLPLAQTSLLQGTVQGVNQVAGAILVVQFSLGRTLMRLVLQIGQIVGNALRPELSRLAASGQTTSKTFKKIVIGTIGISATSYVMLITIAPFATHLLSHGKVEVGHAQAALIGAHALINICWFVWAADIFAQNKHNKVTFAIVISSLVSLAIWWAFKGAVDPLVGASLALVFPEVVALIAVIRAKHAMKKEANHKILVAA